MIQVPVRFGTCSGTTDFGETNAKQENSSREAASPLAAKEPGEASLPKTGPKTGAGQTAPAITAEVRGACYRGKQLTWVCGENHDVSGSTLNGQPERLPAPVNR